MCFSLGASFVAAADETICCSQFLIIELLISMIMVLALIRMMLSRLARNVVAKVTACIVVADRGKNVVKIYDSETGDVKGTVQSKKPFDLPSDITTLPDDQECEH